MHTHKHASPNSQTNMNHPQLAKHAHHRLRSHSHRHTHAATRGGRTGVLAAADALGGMPLQGEGDLADKVLLVNRHRRVRVCASCNPSQKVSRWQGVFKRTTLPRFLSHPKSHTNTHRLHPNSKQRPRTNVVGVEHFAPGEVGADANRAHKADDQGNQHRPGNCNREHQVYRLPRCNSSNHAR